MSPADAIEWYERHAEAVTPQYEALAAGTVHDWLENLLPHAPGLLLDMGAGTGRDAAWLASKGTK
jgi:hypothetical protein